MEKQSTILAKALKQKYNLSENDIHYHKHYVIITRPGIEKIQYLLGIKIKYDVLAVERNFCAVKATGVMTGEEGNKVLLETLASASDQNSQNNYYAEMAEKRAKSRIVLQMAGLYKEGVFGEDEADDFKKPSSYKPRATQESYSDTARSETSSTVSTGKYKSKFLSK